MVEHWLPVKLITQVCWEPDTRILQSESLSYINFPDLKFASDLHLFVILIANDKSNGMAILNPFSLSLSFLDI